MILAKKTNAHLAAHQFPAGKSGNPAGRMKGSRNRLHADFLEALAEDFHRHGVEAIRIARVEKPIEYLKVVAGTLPKQFEIEATTIVQQMPDDEIERLLAAARRQLLQQSSIDATRIDGPLLLAEPRMTENEH
jgi:Family of unknown function (DUF5681)